MADILLPNNDFLTDEEMAFVGGMGGYDLTITEMDPHNNVESERMVASESYEDQLPPDPETRELARRLAVTLIEEGPAAFNDLYLDNHTLLLEAAQFSYALSRLIVIGLKMGISRKEPSCTNNLGALYYAGEIVEQDYARAAELYELAMEWGCHQSIINLGYIYEYGRTGKPDFQKAYQYYALAVALAPTCEALYKFGDMYSRGKAVPRNLPLARALWERSYAAAEATNDPEDLAQPAIRLADLYLRENAEEAGVEPDALHALSLYQQAEIGLRISVGKGADYYRKRLQEALDGQTAARAQLEEDSWRFDAGA